MMLELHRSLFDDKPHPLARAMADWLSDSRRYVSFVKTYHNKIRKKLRTTIEADNVRDLRLELETAYLLTRDRALTLTYEPHHRELGRGPDFAVAYTTRLEFMTEVTRSRASAEEFDDAWLGDSVAAKLGQLLPQHANLLIIGLNHEGRLQLDPTPALARLRRAAEAGDPTVLHRHHFRKQAEFVRAYQRLSALLLRPIPLVDEPVLWINPQAKIALPGPVLNAVRAVHTGPQVLSTTT